MERSTVGEIFVGVEIDCRGDLCGWRDQEQQSCSKV